MKDSETVGLIYSICGNIQLLHKIVESLEKDGVKANCIISMGNLIGNSTDPSTNKDCIEFGRQFLCCLPGFWENSAKRLPAPECRRPIFESTLNFFDSERVGGLLTESNCKGILYRDFHITNQESIIDAGFSLFHGDDLKKIKQLSIIGCNDYPYTINKNGEKRYIDYVSSELQEIPLVGDLIGVGVGSSGFWRNHLTGVSFFSIIRDNTLYLRAFHDHSLIDPGYIF